MKCLIPFSEKENISKRRMQQYKSGVYRDLLMCTVFDNWHARINNR